jgi:hypothetical protein
MLLVGYLYEDYHDARSLEQKVRSCMLISVLFERPNLLKLTAKTARSGAVG